ncbi:MAG: outer membrane protein assembly factor BamA [Candidatus Omnitrophica bacterium]|nr:outer membrane protein assembly factor BamA [Candidatus Omnitrophota bacterium]
MNNKVLFLFILIFLNNSAFLYTPNAWTQTTSVAGKKMVKAIEVMGNKTISIATILSKIKTRVGQEYKQSMISDDLKRLYNTGYFSDVRVDRKEYDTGFKVIIFLEEKPIVEDVTFSKTRYIKVKALSRKIKTKAGKFLDKKSLQDDLKTIKDLYIQKGLTSAEVEVETFTDDVTNKISVHFIIREGHRIRISKIHVNGNETFKDKKIIRIIKTRSKRFFNSGYYKEEVLEEDMERISLFYEKQGFVDAKADFAIDFLQKGFIDIDVQIEEGKRYYVGNITILGNQIISDKEIVKAMGNIEVGNVFSREKLTLDLSHIRTLYFDRGYIFANVKESTALNPKTGEVEVKVDIKEGGLAYIERINVQGNTRTRDIVIRRELRMQPGDRFDGAKLRRSKERLHNLGYFDDVSFDVEDTDIYDRKDLVVQVKEAKTGKFSFGGGFSTVDKIVGFVEIEQRNFDFTNWPTFTGGGQSLTFRAETGSTKNNLLLSFTEPWLYDYPVSAGFDVFRTMRDKEKDIGFAYDEERIGGNLRLGKQFTEYVSGSVMYRNERITVDNLDDNVSAALAAEKGTNTVSSVGFSLKRDSRDSVYNPTRGLVLDGGVDFAGGFLGGDKDFYRVQGKVSYYIPLKFKSVLQFTLKTGMVTEYGDSETVPIFERFFAGGARTIRGYDERKVGPLDPNTNDPVGGEAMVIANIEYTLPLIEYVKLAAFVDTGSVWAQAEDFGTGDLFSGVGLGLRVKTPIGPINLDYGYPLNDEPGEEGRSGKFYFSVSRGF